MYIREAASTTNVSLVDNIFDFLDAGFGHGVDAGELGGPLPSMDYNGYYKAGAALTWAYAGAESATLDAWRDSTGNEANSSVLETDPFANRGGGDYSLVPGHAANTASATGGPIGAHDGTGPIGVVIQ